MELNKLICMAQNILLKKNLKFNLFSSIFQSQPLRILELFLLIGLLLSSQPFLMNSGIPEERNVLTIIIIISQTYRPVVPINAISEAFMFPLKIETIQVGVVTCTIPPCSFKPEILKCYMHIISNFFIP